MKDLFNNIRSDARFSKCGKHRLWLYRIWDETKPLIMFIGLNPSTANAETDDPTIRRVKSMAHSWGYGGVYMTNLFTFISTDPNELDMVLGNHQTSNEILLNVKSKCEKVVCAWGNFNVFGRDKEVLHLLDEAYALHINKNGSPKHPLYVKSDTNLIRYK